jgi:excinuclease ABC subunit A
VLQLTVQEAIDFFETGVIIEKLNVLKRLGLGHLVLGQSGTTLSGGEGQRLKLATALLKTKKGNTLYLFDEPSTGLHYYDILELINVFQSLIDSDDTVLFIEHNSTLIDAADQIVTLGPGSGEAGGLVI